MNVAHTISSVSRPPLPRSRLTCFGSLTCKRMTGRGRKGKHTSPLCWDQSSPLNRPVGFTQSIETITLSLYSDYSKLWVWLVRRYFICLSHVSGNSAALLSLSDLLLGSIFPKSISANKHNRYGLPTAVSSVLLCTGILMIKCYSTYSSCKWPYLAALLGPPWFSGNLAHLFEMQLWLPYHLSVMAHEFFHTTYLLWLMSSR